MWNIKNKQQQQQQNRNRLVSRVNKLVAVREGGMGRDETG